MNTITQHGNVTADPELRFTSSGRGICNFSIAVNGRRFDRERQTWVDVKPVFHRVAVFGAQAENVADSVRQGMAVTVTGEFVDNSYTPRDGDRMVRAVQLNATDVAVSLRWATAVVTRNRQDDPRAPATDDTGQTDPSSQRPAAPTGSAPVTDTDDGDEASHPTTRPAGIRRAPRGPRVAADAAA